MKHLYIYGHPVTHSLSPAMHNAAYQHLGIDNQYTFSAKEVLPQELPQAVQELRNPNARGVAITIPHKVQIIKHLDSIDQTAQTIGSVNTVINQDGQLHGTNTDYLGTIIPLRDHNLDLQGKHVALLGAGGAANAMAYAVLSAGTHLTIYNRTLSKAQLLTDHFKPHFPKANIQALGLNDFEDIPNHDIILNATSLGMKGSENSTPLPPHYLRPHHIVFDAVYTPQQTRLLHDAQAVGATIIHGYNMLLHQGTAQFGLFTGQQAPTNIMKQVLLNKLKT